MVPATVVAMPVGVTPLWLVACLHLVEGAVGGYTGYVTLLALAGFITRHGPRGRRPAKRFAVIIPAHDEHLVVGNLIDSCLAFRYPRKLFEVYVVADNCSDDTADVARAHGARVIERTSLHRRGKGQALADAFPQVLRGPARYDAVVVFDADNLVAPDFLQVMNNELLAGHHVIQGRLDVKNPDDTWVAATFGMSFWTSNRFWFLAKHNLGLTAALGGTGMCISTQALREVGWDATSLTEDLEFSAKALLCGYKTYWAQDAVIYDEKPLTFMQSWRQRMRWAQGQAQVASYYLPRLLWAGFRHRDLIKLEGGVALFQPFYVVLSTGMFAIIPLLAHFWPMPSVQIGVTFWAGLIAVDYLIPLAAIMYDVRQKRPLRFLVMYPIFMYSWIPLTWGGVLRARNHEWVHTAHTRSIAYAELAGGKGTG